MKMIGRFAPSPSGRMHLGNVYTALISWLSARRAGGRWILRIEDLDPQRSKPQWEELIKDDLHWLGLEWDEECRQSDRHHLYAGALERLRSMGLTYPCFCTRADIMATQAPHQSDGRVVYSGRCRPTTLPVPEPERPHATRLVVPDREIRFTDLICGPQSVNLAEHCGDFVLRRADGAWAYQLAVVVDDALGGVTEVVRGEDLLLSTAQQLYLYDLLGFTAPRFAHVPLLRNASGQRLSKRDGAMSMEYLRQHHTPAEVIGMALGVTPCSLQELLVSGCEALSWS